MEGGNAQIEGLIDQLGQVFCVLPRHRHIYLDLDSGGLSVLDSSHRRLECAGGAAEIILEFRGGEVQADADAGQRDFPHLPSDGLGHQGSIGAHDHPEASGDGIFADFKDILTEQRFAAGEDEDGFADLGDLVDQPETLFGRKFAGIAAAMRRGAAVGAG